MSKQIAPTNLIVGLVLILMGLISAFAFVSSASDIYRLNDSKGWPKTEGTVYFSGTEAGCKYNAYYLPSIKYRYVVSNKELHGWRISLGARTCTTKNQAEKISSKYPEGKVVTVFYDPTDPDYSVLLVGNLEGGVVPIFVFSLFMMVTFFTIGYFCCKSR